MKHYLANRIELIVVCWQSKQWRHYLSDRSRTMSKSQDTKKDSKKEAAKTPKEKKAAKKIKKDDKKTATQVTHISK